uniref:Uncharacterized protein n=1 Tax=Hucho hucho TaxID=62062 RepID=A0A4W5JFF8_9TELE
MEEENRHLLEQNQSLTNHNRDLMEQSLERKDQHHSQQREYQEKMGELRREKQKLVEKIMDQYRVLDPSMPTPSKAKKSNWIADRMKKLIKPKGGGREGRALFYAAGSIENLADSADYPPDTQTAAGTGETIQDTQTQTDRQLVRDHRHYYTQITFKSLHESFVLILLLIHLSLSPSHSVSLSPSHSVSLPPSHSVYLSLPLSLLHLSLPLSLLHLSPLFFLRYISSICSYSLLYLSPLFSLFSPPDPRSAPVSPSPLRHAPSLGYSDQAGGLCGLALRSGLGDRRKLGSHRKMGSQSFSPGDKKTSPLQRLQSADRVIWEGQSSPTDTPKTTPMTSATNSQENVMEEGGRAVSGDNSEGHLNSDPCYQSSKDKPAN